MRSGFIWAVFMLWMQPCIAAIPYLPKELPRQQQPAGTNVAVVDAELPAVMVPVVVDGRELFRVPGISVFPAQHRAKAIADRIRAASQNPAIGANSLAIIETNGGSAVLAGNFLIVIATDTEARIEGVDRRILAQFYRDVVAQAVGRYRYERSRPVLLARIGYAFAATAGFLVISFLVRKTGKRLQKAVVEYYRPKFRALKVKTFELLSVEAECEALRKTLAIVQFLVLMVILFFYLDLVLGLFPWTRPVSRMLLGWVTDPLETFGRWMVDAIPKLIFLVILIWITRAVLRGVRLLFEAIGGGVVQVPKFYPEWARPTYNLIRVLIIALAVIIAYPYIPGSSSPAFQGVTIFLGVVFSLGSSTFIANLVAGYTMTYRRAFRLGDRIKIDEILGDVTEIRLLVTHIRTPKNEEVIIPNSKILAGHVVNYSVLAQQQGLILHTAVGVGYEAPWRQVEAMLLLAAEKTPGLLRDPPPFVLLNSLGAFAVNYELNVYCDNPAAMIPLYTALHRNILDLFNEHGVQIMTPSYESDPVEPKVVPREHWHAAPARPPPSAKIP